VCHCVLNSVTMIRAFKNLSCTGNSEVEPEIKSLGSAGSETKKLENNNTSLAGDELYENWVGQKATFGMS